MEPTVNCRKLVVNLLWWDVIGISRVPTMAADVPLSFYQPSGLFLKADARLLVEVKLPEIKAPGVTVSNWEVMEKIKSLSKPEEFLSLRVLSYSREFIQFEGELESLKALSKVVLLLNGKAIKLSGFTELLRVQAKRAQPPYPSKTDWEGYFVERDITSFDEGRPGERPDTLRVSGLPVRWFSSRESEGKPCPQVLTQAFNKFGRVRQVGFYEPPPTPSSSSAGEPAPSFSSFGPGAGERALHFEAFVQYERYSSFCHALSSLKGMSILRLETGGRDAIARITVDFDRTAFLSERNIRKRRRAEERRMREAEERLRREEEEAKAAEERKLAMEREREALEARKKAKRLEERRQRKQQQLELASKLKAVAGRRREQAQRLLGVLLAGAAEARWVHAYAPRLQVLTRVPALTQVPGGGEEEEGGGGADEEGGGGARPAGEAAGGGLSQGQADAQRSRAGAPQAGTAEGAFATQPAVWPAALGCGGATERGGLIGRLERGTDGERGGRMGKRGTGGGRGRLRGRLPLCHTRVNDH